MSDTLLVLQALPRIDFACRRREALDARRGLSLTENQVRILHHLDDRDPTMVTELAEFLGVTPSTMSLNLKRLVEAGFITRSRDPEDRRVMNVLLTPDGARVRDATGTFDPERVHALLARLRPDERMRALDGLAILAEAADHLVARRRLDVAAQTEDVDQ